jgi:hypothetical protein
MYMTRRRNRHNKVNRLVGSCILISWQCVCFVANLLVILDQYFVSVILKGLKQFKIINLDFVYYPNLLHRYVSEIDCISSSKQDTKEKSIALCLPVDMSSNRNSPTEGSDRVGSLPYSPTEGSDRVGSLPYSHTEGSDRVGSLPYSTTEGSDRVGFLPYSPTEGSVSRSFEEEN